MGLRSRTLRSAGAILFGVCLLAPSLADASGALGKYPHGTLKKARKAIRRPDPQDRADAISDLTRSQFGGETPAALDILIEMLERERDPNVLMFLYPALTEKARFFGELARDPEFLKRQQDESVWAYGEKWRFEPTPVDRWLPTLEKLTLHERDAVRSTSLLLIDHLKDPDDAWGTRTRTLLRDQDACTRASAAYALVENRSPYAEEAVPVIEESEAGCFDGHEEFAPGAVIEALMDGRCPDAFADTPLEILCPEPSYPAGLGP